MFEKCQTKVLKSKLAEHLENECSQRKSKCDHCGLEMPFGEVEVTFYTRAPKLTCLIAPERFLCVFY